MANLGFVGLGTMGGTITKRLLDAGHTVTGYNRTRSKAQSLLDAGMKWGETPRQVAETADITFSMVSNSIALREIMHGDNGILAAHLAAADVFVFPSRTDTFGIVQLEALASGVPIAAFPVTGPKDVVGDRPIGVLHDDLGRACMQALGISRDACRKFALDCSWENSARQFLGHARKVAVSGNRELEMPMTITETATG